MKRILLLLAICFSVLSFQSCEDKKADNTDDKGDDIAVSQVPQAVQSAFSAKYAAASDVKWENATEDGTKTYKAKFTLDGKKVHAEYDSTGRFIKED